MGALRGLARIVRITADIWRQWQGDDTAMRALAALDDDDLQNLSEAGQTLRREARRRQPLVRP